MKKILVIDDNEQILDSLKLILEAYGYDVRTHDNGEHVTTLLQEYGPHVLILDMFLGAHNGVELAETIHTQSPFAQLPILLMTANHNVSDIKKNPAIQDLVQKPFEIEELVEKIERLTNTPTPSQYCVM